MAVFKRKHSPKYYMKFIHNGKQIFHTCNTTDKGVAKKRELEERMRLIEEGRSGTSKANPVDVPTLREFARAPAKDDLADHGGRFWAWCAGEHAAVPVTLAYYRDRIGALLRFKPLAEAKLTDINRELLDKYVSELSTQKLKRTTMRKNVMALHLILVKAQDWNLITGLPGFMKFKKEKRIGKAISKEQEAVYRAAVDQDHRDFCSILVSSGMEPGMAAGLAWSDVHFGAVGEFTNGYIFDRCQKTDVRARELGMVEGLAKILKERWMKKGRPTSGYVFPAAKRPSKPTPLSTFQSTHKRLWQKTTEHEPIAIPKFRLYDFRHTALTRAVAGGATAFELKQMAGWASIRMADEYIHQDQKSRAIATDKFSDYLKSQEIG